MKFLLVELTAVEAANSEIVRNIVAAFDLKTVDSLAFNPPCQPLSAAAVFGGAAPLAPAAPAAPSIAGAALPPTAPAVETPSTPAAAVFGQLAATVAAAPPAPSAPAATTSPAGVELDKSGFPWDYRIHAEGKAILKDGTWRQKRNTAPELRAAVEGELRAAGFAAPVSGNPAPVAAPVIPGPPPAPPAAPPAPPVAVTPQLTAEQQAQLTAARQQAATAPVPGFPANPFVPPAAPAAPPAPTGPVKNFAGLMMAVQEAQFARRITGEWFAERRAAYGLASLPTLMQRPDVVECIFAELDAVPA